MKPGPFVSVAVWVTRLASSSGLPDSERVRTQVPFLLSIGVDFVTRFPDIDAHSLPLFLWQELEFEDVTAVLHCVHSFLAAKVASVDPAFIGSQSIARKYTCSS